MRSASLPCRKFASTLALGAVFACSDSQGPPPAVRLLLQGRVQSAEATPVAISGARVELRHFRGLFGDPEILEATATDRLGEYTLTYTINSFCDPEDNTTYWLEASADGYETASTFALTTPDFSDPVIRCTGTAQVINLSPIPFGTLQVITRTSSPAPQEDEYTILISGVIPGHDVGYMIEPNEELTLPPLRFGEYPITLTDLPSSCAVQGDNPRTVTVPARETTTTTFDVNCQAGPAP